MDDIRSLIREVLTEELARIRAGASSQASQCTQETVAIRNSADLNAFAARILDISQNDHLRADILAGRHQFCLEHVAAPSPIVMSQPIQSQPVAVQAPLAPAPQTRVELDKKMITERDIGNLTESVSAIVVGKTVRFTPLANDEVKRRNIRIERRAA